jgi:hypothetical protein
VPSHHWARNFVVEKSDIEFLMGLLLEQEIPLDTETLARALIEEKLIKEAAAVQKRFENVLIYNPSRSYEVGQRVVFPALDYTTAIVVDTRPGNNPDYGAFNVMMVEFEPEDEDDEEDSGEFAMDLTIPHQLSQQDDEDYSALNAGSNLSVDEALRGGRDLILRRVEEALKNSGSLVNVTGKWFPLDLLMDINVGHLNLAEAVLDINGGGPLTTEDILDQMGGLGTTSPALQAFSLNYALRDDERFDEVGPTGEVLWYLARLEPQEVLKMPAMLRYTPIDYDRALLTSDMLALEAEIGDELSQIEDIESENEQGVAMLIYPHRRLGTLPLNARTRRIFPTARLTPRVWVTLVDGQDGEEFPGWVVRDERYVYGLDKFYRKHRLPIGAFVTVQKSPEPGKVIINFSGYRPRTEWIRLIVPKNGQITFENHKRSIGAEYDDLMILGADDLQGVDELFQATQQQRKSLVSILRSIIPGLGRLTPQGTVHAKTIYSAVNALRRCPPGPIFATLVANPDFENVGGDYWRLSGA